MLLYVLTSKTMYRDVGLFLFFALNFDEKNNNNKQIIACYIK